jgi:hypothetical protein
VPLPDAKATADPAPFAALLDDLRSQGFIVGVGEYLRLRSLVEHAAQSCEPSDLKTLLCPLLAKNEDQQEQFYRTFDQHFPWLSAPPETAAEAPSAAPLKARTVRPHRWLFLMSAVVIASGLVWGLVDATQRLHLLRWQPAKTAPKEPNRTAGGASSSAPEPSRPTAPPPSAPRPGLGTRYLHIADASSTIQDTPRFLIWYDWVRIPAGWAALMAPPLFLLAYEAYVRYLRRLVLRRRKQLQPPFRWPVQARDSSRLLFDEEELAALARNLRRRQASTTMRIDIDATVRASLEEIGLPQFRYRADQQYPEYLFLVDRQSRRDHQARWIEQVVAELQRRGVFIALWFFDGDPRVAWTAGNRARASLRELHRLYPDHRVLVFAEAECLLDPLNGSPAACVYALRDWTSYGLATTRPARDWSADERRLSAELPLFEASANGLLAAAEYFDRGQAPRGGVSRTVAARERLSAAEVRSRLSPRAFECVCACALYPELQWPLTWRMAATAGLDDSRELMAVFRLPWFRSGVMPEPLRLELAKELAPERKRLFSATVVEVLEQSPAPEGTFADEERDLQIAVQRYAAEPESRATRRELRRVVRGMPPEQVAVDGVQLEWLDRATRSRLDFVVPRRIRSWIYPNGLPLFGPRAFLRIGAAVLAVPAGLAALKWADSVGSRYVGPQWPDTNSEVTQVFARRVRDDIHVWWRGKAPAEALGVLELTGAGAVQKGSIVRGLDPVAQGIVHDIGRAQVVNLAVYVAIADAPSATPTRVLSPELQRSQAVERVKKSMPADAKIDPKAVAVNIPPPITQVAAPEQQQIALSSAGVLPPPQLAKAEKVQAPLLKNAYSVVVGISQYQDASVAALQYASIDARSLHNLLQSQGGASGGLSTLLNLTATRLTILDRVQRAVSAAQPGDSVLFYFSGHSLPDQGILLPADGRMDALPASGISLNDLTARMKGPFRSIVIIDAPLSSKAAPKIPAFDNALVIAANSAAEGAQFGGGHGELTWNVLRALGGEADANKDGRVTVSELVDFLAKEKPSQGGQPPTVENGLPGDLPLVELSGSKAKVN